MVNIFRYHDYKGHRYTGSEAHARCVEIFHVDETKHPVCEKLYPLPFNATCKM